MQVTNYFVLEISLVEKPSLYIQLDCIQLDCTGTITIHFKAKQMTY